MRLNIRNITETLGCDEAFALKVEYQMEVNGVDFSESTSAELKREIKYALEDIGETV
jgi:hypothetical protein